MPPLQEPVGHVAAVYENPLPTNSPPLGLSAVPLPTKARRTLPGCHVAVVAAEATGAPTAAGPEPPALIAPVVGLAALTATREAKSAVARDTAAAAAGRGPAAPADASGA